MDAEKKQNNLRLMYFSFFFMATDIFIEKFLHLTNFIEYRKYITRLKIKSIGVHIFHSRNVNSSQTYREHV